MTIFCQNPHVAFIYANACPSNPVPNRPVIHEEGTGSAFTPFGVAHFHINRTKQQILADLMDVLSNDDDLSTYDKSIIYRCVEEALDVAEWNDEEEEASVLSSSLLSADDDDDDDDDNDGDYVPPLRRPCIQDELNSSSETQEDRELLQLVSYKRDFDE